MTLYNKYSSSTLSTLFPQYSTESSPNYNNAFNLDLSNFQNIVNQSKFSTGLKLSDSNNYVTQLVGNGMTQGAIDSLGSNQSSFINMIDGSRNLDFQSLGKVNTGLNIANSLFTSIFGEKDEYSGEKGNITRGIDNTVDAIGNVAGMIPGGQLVQLGLGVNKLFGNVANKLGAGTDAMTTQDAILGSQLFQLSPLGLINGIFGKHAHEIVKDEDAFERVGTSYTGTEANVDEALTKSGKKYGAFSGRARRKANRLIDEADRQQNIVDDIADEADLRFAIKDSMSAINGNRMRYNLQGGYNQAAIRVGKSGMSLDLINKAKKVLSEPRKLQTGGTAKDPFEYYVSTLPVAQRDSSNFRVRDYWQYNGQPKDFDEAKKRGMFEWVEDFDSNGKSLGWSWHAFTVAKNPNADEYDFMKSSSHPTVQKELDWYNSNSPDAVEFRNNYELQRTEPYWKYVRRKRDTISHKEGGQMKVKATEILIVEPELIEDGVDSFKDGGAINIIPEGALHAHKHNMDIEGITPKGIPVVSNKEGGEVEQQAEIEREEIIFRLEVTKKLEELEKKFYDSETSQKEKDECALEAGKLLVEEILYNTQDNTNKLL